MATSHVFSPSFKTLLMFFLVLLFSPSIFSQVPTKQQNDAESAIIGDMEGKIKTCTAVYDPKKGYGVVPLMPVLFQSIVPVFVTLRDRVGNKFDVEVRVSNGDLHILRGWTTLGSFYNLDEYGGWIQFTYLNDFSFFMRVLDRLYEDVHVPEPPSYFPIPSAIAQVVPSSADLPSEVFAPHPRKCFHYSNGKFLTTADLTKLCISHYFCLYALPRSLTIVTIVDEWNRSWLCPVEWRPQDTLQLHLPQVSMECYLGGAWADFCKLRCLKEGQEIRIGVAKDCRHVIYISLMWFYLEN